MRLKHTLWQVVFAYLLSALLLAGVALAASADSARILVYGDSITWGYVPTEQGVPPQRFSAADRWTGALQKELGKAFTIVEEGLNGRTAGVDLFHDDLAADIRGELNLNGRPTLLPIVRSHEPLALVVIMLGTNDTRPGLKQDVSQITASVGKLIQLIKKGSSAGTQAKILLIAPPPGQKGQSAIFNAVFADSYGLARQLAAAYKELATREQVDFFDAASVVPVADGVDGIHLTADGNRKLAKAVAAKIKTII